MGGVDDTSASISEGTEQDRSLVRVSFLSISAYT